MASCLICAGQIKRKSGAGRPPIYCSSRCRWRGKPYQVIPCKGCGVLFESKGSGFPLFHNAKCRERFLAANPRSLHDKICQQCGQGFKGRVMQRFCGLQCASDSRKGRDAVRAQDRAHRNRHRRRARLAGTQCEIFRATEIFERDGWACYLCGESVDPVLKYPDPMSKSLDHRIPISKGGHHTRENCACTHLECNVAKRNRLPAGMMIPMDPPDRLLTGAILDYLQTL